MKETALVLAGGGAKGSYQAHIASQIMKNENVTVITGVSAGALNGAILSQGDPDHIKEIWKGLRRDDVWSGGYSILRYIKMAFGYRLGLFTAGPLQERLEKEFDPNDATVPLEAGCVSLKNGRYVPYTIDPDETYDGAQIKKARKFITASAAVPVGVEPVEVDGELLADGGIRNIAPVKDAIKYEPDRIVAIFNSNLSRPAVEGGTNPTHVLQVGESAIRILLNETLRSDVMAARRVNKTIRMTGMQEVGGASLVPITKIEPSRDLGSAQDFSQEAHDRRANVARHDYNAYLKDKQ